MASAVAACAIPLTAQSSRTYTSFPRFVPSPHRADLPSPSWCLYILLRLFALRPRP